jgi:hypothetical protein
MLTAFKRFVVTANGQALQQEHPVIAYGIQYPDKRIVLCLIDSKNGLQIHNNVEDAVQAFGRNAVLVQWID